jgi:hypothetical protein
MISYKEIIFCFINFIIIYLVLFCDKKINSDNKEVSIKIPLIFTIIGFILYKLFEKNIISFFDLSHSIVKQDIITEMADF